MREAIDTREAGMNRMDIAAELATELDNAIDEPELANELDKASDEAIHAPWLDATKALAASLGMDFKSFIDAQYHAMAACTGSASDRGASSPSGHGVTPLFGSTPSSSSADGGVKPDDADGADAEADKGDDAATEPHTPYKDDDAVSISSSQATTLQWGGSTATGSSRSDFWDTKLVPSPGESYCQNCFMPLDPIAKGVRVCGKAACPQFKCPKCSSKTVALSNLFGGWPIEEFRDLPSELQKAFWQEAASCNDLHGLKKCVEKHVVRRLINQKINAKDGEFNTLNFFKGQGYNIEWIEQNCDSEFNPDLGEMTYRVRLHRVSEKMIEEGVQTHMLQLLSRTKMATQARVVANSSAACQADAQPPTDHPGPVNKRPRTVETVRKANPKAEDMEEPPAKAGHQDPYASQLQSDSIQPCQALDMIPWSVLPPVNWAR